MKLAKKLLLLVILSSLVGILLIGIISFILTRSALKKSIGNQQLQLAQQMMDKIDRLLYERYNDVQTMAGDETIENFLSAAENRTIPIENTQSTIAKRINDLSIVTGPWDDIDVLDMNGVILYSLDQTLIGKKLDRNAQDFSIYDHARNGATTYSDAFVDSDSQKPTVLFATPIRDSNDPTRKIIGAVVSHLSWPLITEVLESVNGPDIDLYNRDSQEIANNYDSSAFFKEINTHLNKAQVLKEGKLSSVSQDEEGKQIVSAEVSEQGFLEYKGSGWILLMKQSPATAFAPAANTALLSAGILAPIIILINSILFFILLRLLHPIGELTSATKHIAGGDFSQRAPVHSQDEIGQLASAFNYMADKLNELYSNLEQKVKEKTAELEKEKAGVEQKVIERTHELSYEQARLQASINSLSIGYLMTGIDNQVILINNAAKDILTLSTKTAKPADRANDVSEIRDKIDMQFVNTVLRDKVDLLAQIEEAKKRRAIVILKDIAYKMLFLNLYISPIVNKTTEQVIGSVILIEDITEQKIIERSRDEFFSIASHELRTPLTAIRGNASIIQDFYKEEIKNPEVQEIVNDIHKSSVRLIQIVNDFLDVSRLEQGKLEFNNSACDLLAMSEDVVKEYDVTGSRKKLYLRVTKPEHPLPLAYVDKDRMRQILVNLVGNGIKFTNEGGVDISFGQSENHVDVFITDTGMGIPQENQNLLFRKFQQAESNILTRDATRGTGLGLYISKVFMDNMGGSIVLEKSEIGKGSTFKVSVPIVTPSQVAESTQETHV